MEERTRTEQDGVGSSITEELRECIKTANRSYEDTRNPYNDREVLHIVDEELLAIADRIDERHAEGVQLAWADGIARAEGDLKAFEAACVKLPVDADGVPIHIGDRVEWSNGSFTVHELKLTEDGWQTWDSEHGYTVHADECIRHVQPDSWETIIQDAVKLGYADYPTTDYEAELVERCRRLAGETE